jgi:hypothetical protein
LTYASLADVSGENVRSCAPNDGGEGGGVGRLDGEDCGANASRLRSVSDSKMAGKGHLTRTVHDGQMRMPKEFFLIRVVLRDVLQRWEISGEDLQR